MTKKNIIIIGVLLVLSFVAYGIFFKGDRSPASGLVSSGSISTTTPRVGKEIVSALASLETLKLDTSFFQNDIFKKLKNFTKPIPVQPVRRSNPFAPIGTGGSSNSVPNATSTNR